MQTSFIVATGMKLIEKNNNNNREKINSIELNKNEFKLTVTSNIH